MARRTPDLSSFKATSGLVAQILRLLQFTSYDLNSVYIPSISLHLILCLKKNWDVIYYIYRVYREMGGM